MTDKQGGKALIKHVIFDFDGTVADSEALSLQVFNEIAAKYGYRQLTMDELKTLNNSPIKERLKQVGIPLYKVPKLLMESLGKYRQRLGALEAFHGIHDLLLGLKKEGLHLSIISSNAVENIKDFFHKSEIEVFDHIFSAKNIFGKHISIKKYLKQFKLKPEEVIYIGDELRDIEACKKVPVKIIAVTWGFDSLDLLKSGKPDYIALEPKDIMEIIKEKI